MFSQSKGWKTLLPSDLRRHSSEFDRGRLFSEARRVIDLFNSVYITFLHPSHMVMAPANMPFRYETFSGEWTNANLGTSSFSKFVSLAFSDSSALANLF